MPSFAYRAVSPSGRISSGEFDAASEDDLAHYLSQSGLELLDARERNENVRSLRLVRRSISRKTLAFFCSALNDLLSAGLSFPDSLRNVSASTNDRMLADALARISRSIADGKGIADSFALYPNLFPPIAISVLGAGEESGDMPSALRYLTVYTANDAKTHERLMRAIRYPAFLFVTAGSAVVFMLSMVVPQVVQYLNGIGGKLPFMTRLLVSVSEALSAYGLYALGGVLLAVPAVWAARSFSAGFALAFDKALLRLPGIGGLLLKNDMARFAHAFSILFRSGCTLAVCLHRASETLVNRHLRDRAENAEIRVQQGTALSEALKGVLPPFAIGLLRTGESSGRLAKSLDDIACAYDAEAAHAVDAFLGLLEPVLTLAIGAVLAWTVLAVLGPLYGSLSALGGRG